jgi:hypothetical protein
MIVRWLARRRFQRVSYPAQVAAWYAKEPTIKPLALPPVKALRAVKESQRMLSLLRRA